MDKPLVKVTWHDAEDLTDTWADTDKVNAFTDDESPMESVGYLVRKTEKYLTLAGDWDASNGNWGTVRKLPISVVRSIEELHP